MEQRRISLIGTSWSGFHFAVNPSLSANAAALETDENSKYRF
jgi:hypothetical protein